MSRQKRHPQAKPAGAGGPRRSLLVALASAAMAGLLVGSPVLAAGTAFSWGSNAQGTLGIGLGPFQATSRTAPIAVSNLGSNVQLITGGERQGLAVQNGALYAWGYNEAGELGNGNSGVTASVYAPAAVPTLSSGVTAVSGGGYFSIAVRNGAAFGWGYNLYGQIGNGSIDPSFQVHAAPTPIVGLSSGVTAVSSGLAHSVAIQNGTVVAWGYNPYGQLGNGNTANSGTPAPVLGLPGNVTAVSAGAYHSLALADGAVYSWGDNTNGGLGNTQAGQTTVASVIPELSSGVTAIAAGTSFGLALKDGQVYAWGSNRWGQLGNGEMDFGGVITPAVISAITGTITQLATTSSSAYALSADGGLWVWGRNDNGELGLGYESDFVATPTRLFAPAGFRFESIAGGSNFAFATVVTASIAGDYNGDGFVDAADYTVWADHFGQTGSSIAGDGNNDGVVDAADYTVWADHFGQGSAPAGVVVVPEPAAFGLLAVPVLILARRRR